MSDLTPWIGRTETRTDSLSAAHCARIAALFDRKDVPKSGDPLPPLWHWCFFTPETAQAEMGVDGHPKLGSFMPPIAHPRRMWAGGRLKFLQPLRVCEDVTRETEILSIAEKSGRQGTLVFVTLRHRLSGAAGLAIEEEQDIVYRSPTRTQRPGPAERAPAEWRDVIRPDPVLLFRYSSLTYNAHRIHYDLAYATGEEDYPALVVHGPLTATLLMQSALSHSGGRPESFAFRGLAPLFADEPFSLCGTTSEDTLSLWAEGPGGYAAMTASLTLRAEGA